MLAIEVELLHGGLRAGSPDDLAVTGRDDPGEWPPSPARLFAALVAADGTRDRMRVTDGAELRLLEAAPPPVILADPRMDVLSSAQQGRYVVTNELNKGATQEYIARKNTLVRPAPRLHPKEPRVVYLWPALNPGEAELQGLRLRAGRVGYLGCADSPVRLRVRTHEQESDGDVRRRWEPDATGQTHVPVPFAGLQDVLDRMYDDFSSGLIPRRTWYRTHRARYRAPDDDAPQRTPSPIVLWLRLETPVTGRHALAVSNALRGAVLSAYEAHVAGRPDAVDAVLHGHGFEGTGYDHASWLVLPDVGHPHATGRLHGLAVALPPGTDAAVVEGLRTALWHARSLRLPGGRTVGVSAHQGERRPWAANPRRWVGPSRRWVSALPVVHERWTKRGPELPEIARWCRNAGIGAPVVGARVGRHPFVAGGVSLMPHETVRGGQMRRPYSHLMVELADEVAGPVVLGRQRHFGLGLMAPVADAAEENGRPS